MKPILAAPTTPPKNRLDLFFRDLGPGLITGCADDDPSGIATYSVAGAAFGYASLWTALLSLPLMVSVQLMWGRFGMVTGKGLAAVVRQHTPRRVLWGSCLLLITAKSRRHGRSGRGGHRR
jgi:Mn2+/Fe2+ NRAMP family transporter